MAVVKPYDFTVGTPIAAEEVNEDFDVIYNILDGGIMNEHINANACIDWSKINVPSIGEGIAFIVGWERDTDLPLTIPADELETVMIVIYSVTIEFASGTAVSVCDVRLTIDESGGGSPTAITINMIRAAIRATSGAAGVHRVTGTQTVRIPEAGAIAGGSSPTFDKTKAIELDMEVTNDSGDAETISDETILVFGV